METKKMDIKQKTAYVTAIIAFALGWFLVIAGFYMPPQGEVADSVLWILGQALIYTASVLGVTMYFNSQMEKFRHDTRSYIRHLEREKDEEKSEEYYETES